MDVTKFEDKVNELILEARQAGLDNDEITSVIEVILMSLKEGS